VSSVIDGMTTTSYAILGELALRDWTTYALATQMRRNLHFFWPAAESRIYEQAKRLERQGLARSRRTFVGKRARTTYSITAAGKVALRQWMAAPPADTVTESEALLRTFLATVGTREDLLRAIDSVGAQAHAMQAVGREVAAEYLGGDSEFGSELHVRALTFDFLWRHSEFLLAWAESARAEVSTWQELETTPEKNRRARAIFEASRASPSPERGPDG
jgi:DNA-binding PadR family transcriptional regulator